MKPLLMPPNVLQHFYRGGEHIAALRGNEQASEFSPEEWLAATVSRAGAGDTGLSRVGSQVFRDLVAADPGGWIGPATPIPGDTGELVKLLDAGQRLPVHVHPDRAFARSHLDCPYGKTEAWFVLGTSESGDEWADEPSVWLGWAEEVDPIELRNAIEAQDSDWMLQRMHRRTVRPGDGILVPAGTVHAIGAGVFVAEVQEPSDFSIVLEWVVTTSGREDSHLGLGFDTVLDAVGLGAFDADRLAELMIHSDPAARRDQLHPLLPPESEPFFRLHRAAPAGEAVAVPAGYAVAVVLSGHGVFRAGESLEVTGGQVWAVPFGFGDWSVAGEVDVLVCRPGAGWPGTLELPG